MLDIQYLRNCNYFENISLKKGDVLFNEGDVDEYLYIIISGRVNIGKYIDSSQQSIKVLAQLRPYDIIGEAALNNNDPKQVSVQVVEDSELIRIHAKEGVAKIMSENPEKALDLLSHVIDQSNTRLLTSNAQITSTYRMTKAISEISAINNKVIFDLIDQFNDIIASDYIIYIEKNPVLDEYYSLKYDTRNKGKLGDMIIEIEKERGKNISEILHDLKINNLAKYNIVNKLNVGSSEAGYLVIGKAERNFSDNDRKIISSISTALSGVINKKRAIDEQHDRDSLSN